MHRPAELGDRGNEEGPVRECGPDDRGSSVETDPQMNDDALLSLANINIDPSCSRELRLKYSDALLLH